MASRVITNAEFDSALNQGLAPEQFKYRFLVEGDSWMDRSTAFSGSLPGYLARTMDAAREEVLIINLSRFGDTLRRIGECLNSDFAGWLNSTWPWRFDALLLSVGGNDFIDAARDPDPGMGILRNLAGQIAPAQGHQCVKRDAVTTLVNEYLDPNFKLLYEMVQSTRHTDVPIFLNNYDTPTARYAPTLPGGKAWLQEAFSKNAIPPVLWPDLTGSIFNDLQTTIAGWTVGRPNVFVVPTDGTLIPADPGSTGNSGDWVNEIHPNAAGWKKLAPIWRNSIKEVLR